SLGADACGPRGPPPPGGGRAPPPLPFPGPPPFGGDPRPGRANLVRAVLEGEPRPVMADFDAACGGRMSAFVDAGTHAICTASPELLVAFEREAVECRPVSGRYSRGLSAAADRRHAGWLRDSESGR